MSRYALKWLPQGAIPRDVDIKVEMQPAVVPGSDGGAGKCQPAFAGYAVTGDAAYNASESGSIQTWNFPCTGSPWTIVILGFAVGCGKAFSWRHDIDNGTTLEAHVTFTEGTDPLWGGPMLTISGDGTDGCVDSSATITIGLLLDGDVTFSQSIQLRPTPPPLQLQFDGGSFIGGTDEWTFFSTGDGINGGGLSVTMPPGGADAEYQFAFEVLNSSSVTWSVSNSSDPGFSVSWFNGSPNAITFDVSRTGGANGLAISFYATDDLTGNVIPIGAPGTQFQIVG